MKGFFGKAIITLVIGAIVFTACSGRKESPSQSTVNQNVPVQEQSTTSSLSTETVAGYLAQFGLSENDIKPAAFTSFELGDRSIFIKVSNNDDLHNWFKQVYDKTKNIADEGKLYNDMFPYVEGEHTWNEPTAGTIQVSWAYMYNGTTCRIQTIQETGGYLLSLY